MNDLVSDIMHDIDNEIKRTSTASYVPPATSINLNKILKKIIRLRSIFVFAISYTDYYTQILSGVATKFFSSVTENAEKMKMSFKFFTEIAGAYKISVGSISKTLSIVPQDDALKETFEEEQKKIDSMTKIYKGLSEKLASADINNAIQAIEDDEKKILKFISRITHRKTKLTTMYNERCKKDFDLFLSKFNDVINIDNIVVNLVDLFTVERAIISRVNKLYNKLILISTQIKSCIENSKNIFVNTSEIYNACVNLYTKKEEPIGKVEEVELGSELGREMNECLNKLQTELIKQSDLKEEIVFNDELFTMNYYKNDIIKFISFLISLTPNEIPLDTSLVRGKLNCIKDNGLFKRKEKCTLILTEQNHIIIDGDQCDIYIKGKTEVKKKRDNLIEIAQIENKRKVSAISIEIDTTSETLSEVFFEFA